VDTRFADEGAKNALKEPAIVPTLRTFTVFSAFGLLMTTFTTAKQVEHLESLFSKRDASSKPITTEYCPEDRPQTSGGSRAERCAENRRLMEASPLFKVDLTVCDGVTDDLGKEGTNTFCKLRRAGEPWLHYKWRHTKDQLSWLSPTNILAALTEQKKRIQRFIEQRHRIFAFRNLRVFGARAPVHVISFREPANSPAFNRLHEYLETLLLGKFVSQERSFLASLVDSLGGSSPLERSASTILLSGVGDDFCSDLVKDPKTALRSLKLWKKMESSWIAVQQYQEWNKIRNEIAGENEIKKTNTGIRTVTERKATTNCGRPENTQSSPFTFTCLSNPSTGKLRRRIAVPVPGYAPLPLEVTISQVKWSPVPPASNDPLAAPSFLGLARSLVDEEELSAKQLGCNQDAIDPEIPKIVQKLVTDPNPDFVFSSSYTVNFMEQFSDSYVPLSDSEVLKVIPYQRNFARFQENFVKLYRNTRRLL
jgi:hypothetical protein